MAELADNYLALARGSGAPYVLKKVGSVRDAHTSVRNTDHNAQVMLTSGDMKGQVVIMVVADSGFRFLDLPTETREQVYRLVLVQTKPILISTFKNYDTKVVSGQHFTRASHHQGQVWNKETGKWVGGPPSSLSLLRANKQIHQEATPIAYGANTFEQHRSTALKWFTPRIGNSVEHLTFIDFGAWSTWPVMKMAFASLRTATGLRKLVFNFQMICDAFETYCKGGTPERWAVVFSKGLRPLLKSLQRAYDAQGRTWKAVDVPHLGLEANKRYDCYIFAGQRAAIAAKHKLNAERLMGAVRKLNEKYL
jgi:hypothetical protein